MKSLEDFEKRLQKLEKREFEDTLTLIEILSTMTFFGGVKMKKCKYAKEGQCGLFFLKSDAEKKTPMSTDCRIKGCKGEPGHRHLELSNVTCAFCPEWLPNQQTERDSE